MTSIATKYYFKKREVFCKFYKPNQEIISTSLKTDIIVLWFYFVTLFLLVFFFNYLFHILTGSHNLISIIYIFIIFVGIILGRFSAIGNIVKITLEAVYYNGLYINLEWKKGGSKDEYIYKISLLVSAILIVSGFILILISSDGILKII